MASPPRFRAYTDGGADPNPGPGGWGVVILDPGGGEPRELSGGDPATTNNRMELTATVRALEALPADAPAAVYTDSIYLKRGVTEWLPGWIARGWRRRTGALQNEDLWRRLAELLRGRDVSWHWVKGHAGHRYNERADRLASAEIQAHHRRTATPAPAAQAEVLLRVSGGGGRGGWAAAVRHGGEERVATGSVRGASANELDVLAAAEVLEGLPEGITVALYTGSDYLRNGATRWLPAWRRGGWTTRAGTPVKNRSAWERLDAAMERRRVVWPALGEPLPEGWKELGRRAREAG